MDLAACAKFSGPHVSHSGIRVLTARCRIYAKNWATSPEKGLKQNGYSTSFDRFLTRSPSDGRALLGIASTRPAIRNGFSDILWVDTFSAPENPEKFRRRLLVR